MNARVAVIGGGASGISASWWLQKHGYDVDLHEREQGLGGRMRAFPLDGRAISLGGKNVGLKFATFRRFVADCGAAAFEPFGLHSSQIVDGRIVTIDARTRMIGLVQLLARARPDDIWLFLKMAAAVLRSPDDGFLGGPFFERLQRSFGGRRAPTEIFGDELCRRIVRPMTVRMNGAEPDEVSIGSLGTNLRMIFDKYEQLIEGIGPVLDAFSRKVNVILSSRVEAVRPIEGGGVSVSFEGSGARDYDAVIVATPAHSAARLLGAELAAVRDALLEVRYNPVGIVVARYRRPIFEPKVRAIVFDADEPLSNAGAYGVRELDVIRYTFSGRGARPVLAARPSMEDLLALGEAILGRHLRVRAEDRRDHVGTYYDPGLCAYHPDHARFRALLATELSRVPGIYLAGDYCRGASIEACFRAGVGAAEQVLTAARG